MMHTPERATAPARHWQRRLHEHLLLLSLLVNPSKRRAHAIYEMVSTENLITEQSLFLNLGYWQDGPQTLDDACVAMAVLLGETAQLGPEDRVLDVGFGFADQDLLWMERFAPRAIVGVNITRSQVEQARRRVAARHLEDRIDLRHGSATSLPFEAATFDKVMALECAFHFPTREAFFREAFRVLRPGGRIATTDIIPMPRAQPLGLRGKMIEYVGRAFWQIPKENMYPVEIYRDKLQQAGFVDVEVRSIQAQVMEPFARHSLQRINQPEVARRMHPFIRLMFISSAQATLEQPASLTLFDYVVASGVKPAH